MTLSGSHGNAQGDVDSKCRVLGSQGGPIGHQMEFGLQIVRVVYHRWAVPLPQLYGTEVFGGSAAEEEKTQCLAQKPTASAEVDEVD